MGDAYDAFENYGKKVEQAYEKWQKTVDKQFFNINCETDPKALIVKIAEKIVAEFEDVKLIDKYDVYEVLLAYWQAVMADDVYLVKNDGYEAGGELEIFYRENRKKDGSVSKGEKIALKNGYIFKVENPKSGKDAFNYKQANRKGIIIFP